MFKWVATAGAMMLIVCCGADETVSSEVVESSGEVEEIEQASLVDSVSLTLAGTAAEGTAGGRNEFIVGDVLDLTVTIAEVPAGLAAWVHWTGPAGERIAEEQKPVPEDGTVVFRADTTGWMPGSYTAEVRVGGALADTRTFLVRESVPGVVE